MDANYSRAVSYRKSIFILLEDRPSPKRVARCTLLGRFSGYFSLIIIRKGSFSTMAIHANVRRIFDRALTRTHQSSATPFYWVALVQVKSIMLPELIQSMLPDYRTRLPLSARC